MNRWIIAAGLILSPLPALTQGPSVPTQMTFQGRLTTPSGNPVPNGTYNITLRLFNAASGGTKYWERLVSGVPVRNGTFATTLDLSGGFTAGNTLLTTFNTAAPYLEIQIGTDVPLAPRLQLSSSAYTLKSNTVADGAIGTNQLANGAVTNAKIAAGTIAADRLVGGLAFPPSGAAGGDLTGTYPNPFIASNAVNSSKLAYDASSIARVSASTISIGNYTYILDQTQNYALIDGSLGSWQSFTPSGSGYLKILQVYLGSTNGLPLNTTLDIYSGEGTGGTLLSTQSVSFATTYAPQNIYLNTPPYLSGGTKYTWYLHYTAASNIKYAGSNPYAGGTCDYGTNYDYWFVTFMSPSNINDSIGFSSNVGIGTSSPSAKLDVYTNLGYAINAYSSSNTAIVVTGSGTGNAGMVAYGTGGARAATLYGDVYVGGTLSKAAGSFVIDHPLDPANKTLSHSFVESPDMMNIYNGNIKTDTRGYATVKLPAWFAALNTDYRYQLTPIGTFAQAIVAKEVTRNAFVIRTSKPNIKVSWMVTGIRNDAYARHNRIPTESLKVLDKRGTYLYPEGFAKNKPRVADKK